MSKAAETSLGAVKEEDIISSINHGNSFSKLLRIVAYIMRMKQRPLVAGATINLDELERARKIVLRIIQQKHFTADFKNLKKSREVEKSSNISSLTPFLDQDDLIKVGGRLEAYELAYDAKHPILLPYNDSIVKLIFEKVHKENMHCGAQALVATSRQRYWAIKAKKLARNVVLSCVKCTRAKPKLMEQIMGHLPPLRVTQARPFLNAGVDYCGPFKIHYKIRGKKPHTAHIAIFCCFATKAVHLELVSDLTTEAFLEALRRFMPKVAL